jgi:hypothetical protein
VSGMHCKTSNCNAWYRNELRAGLARGRYADNLSA